MKPIKETLLDKINLDNKYTYISLLIPFLAIYLYFLPIKHTIDFAEHYYKSYYIANGNLSIFNPKNKCSSGGDVDNNFKLYIATITEINPKLTTKYKKDLKKLKFSKTKSFIAFPGSSTYPPILYIPNAIIIKISMLLDLTIHNTILSIKTFSAFIFLIIMFYIFSILKIGKELFLFVSILPTTIIQATTGVIEGYIIALSILMITLFLNTLKENKITFKTLLLFYFISIILITTKPNFLPFLFLYLVIFNLGNKKYNITLFLFSLFIIFAWFYYTSTTLIDPRRENFEIPITTIILNTITNPIPFLEKMFYTIIFQTPYLLLTGIVSLTQYNYIEKGVEYLYFYDVIYAIIFYYLIITILGTQTNLNIKIEKKQIYILRTLYIMSFLFIFYLIFVFNTQKESYIFGLHGRYFILYLFFIIILFYDKKQNIYKKYNDKFYKYFIYYYFILFILTLYSLINIKNEIYFYKIID
jgi:uncharacterized membrane protein